MRRGVLAGTLVLFLAWFLVKALPFLTDGRPATWATPTSTPFSGDQLAPVTVPAGGRICVSGMPWAPDARYVQLRVLPGVRGRSPALDVLATAPGYRAAATIPAGLPQNADAIAKIDPAPREVTGSLCVTNRGTTKLGFYGVLEKGRLAAPVEVTVDGRPSADRQLSVTLLTNPSQSLLGRFDDVLDHVAAFRPVGPWLVWLLALALMLGTPLALALTLAAAVGEDERDDDAPEAP
jgi:hypothetical protein